VNSNFTLVDVAEKMIDIAKLRFESAKDQFSYFIEDYRKFIPDSQFDLIISSLSIHHLNNLDKQNLFKQIVNQLNPGGVFINVDQIKAPGDYFHNMYWDNWLNNVRNTNASENEIQESISRRKEFDQDATMTDQLNWLKQAGFSLTDCLYHHYFVGVFYAQV